MSLDGSSRLTRTKTPLLSPAPDLDLIRRIAMDCRIDLTRQWWTWICRTQTTLYIHLTQSRTRFTLRSVVQAVPKLYKNLISSCVRTRMAWLFVETPTSGIYETHLHTCCERTAEHGTHNEGWVDDDQFKLLVWWQADSVVPGCLLR